VRLPPQVLLAVAAALVAANVAVVVARSGGEPGADAPSAEGAGQGDPAGDAPDVATSPTPDAVTPSPDPDPDPDAEDPDAEDPDAEGAGDPGDADADTDADATGRGDRDGDGDGGSGGTTTAPPPAMALRLPAEGSYAYDATGFQEVDVDGARRALPATASGSVTHAGESGWVLDLDAGGGSRDVRTHSVAGAALRLDTWMAQRSLPGQTASTTYRCEPADLHRLDGREGRSVTVRCQGPDSTIAGTLVQLADAQVTLGDGTTVRAAHLRLEYTESGDDVDGRGVLEAWVEPATGMRLRERREVTTTLPGRLGPVEYREQVDLRLRSLAPMLASTT